MGNPWVLLSVPIPVPMPTHTRNPWVTSDGSWQVRVSSGVVPTKKHLFNYILNYSYQTTLRAGARRRGVDRRWAQRNKRKQKEKKKENKRNGPGDACPQGQKKTKKQKRPGDECLLGLSPRRLSFPLLPISFDVAGYAGGLDAAGVGVPPSSPRCSSSSRPRRCLPRVVLIHGAPCEQLLAAVGVGAGSPSSSAVEIDT
jgi:hypothetical protein